MTEHTEQPVNPTVGGDAKKPVQHRLAAWLLAEACMFLALFSCGARAKWSHFHWTLFDMSPPLVPDPRLSGFIDGLMIESWILLGLSLLCFIVGICIRPRRAALVALPFLLVALLMMSIQE